MSRLPPRRQVVHAALALGLGLTAVACGDEQAPVTGTDPSASADVIESPSESASPSESPSASPTGTPSVTETPTMTPSPTSGPASEPGTESLLTAREMPGLNELTRWQEVGTRPEGSHPTGDCQRFDLVTIGAAHAVVREFEATGTAGSAVQVVATFADDASATRAHEVIKTWHSRCAEQLQADVEKIGEMTPVSVKRGEAAHYLVQFGARGATTHDFDGVAVVRVGPRISVVQIDTRSQDYNYPAGSEPAARAARAAAARLG